MSGVEQNLLESLPVFSDGSAGKSWKGLQIEGLVSRPLSLTAEDLSEFPQEVLSEDFQCTEGWVVPDLVWEGVPLRELLDMAGPSPDSNYVSVRAGDYAIGLTLYDVYFSDVIVALKLGHRKLPLEHGGPCRLVASGKQCHFSVKWIDRIEVTAQEPEDTGRIIAEARIRQDSNPR